MTVGRAPLAAPALAGITHQPTRDLTVALYEHGWAVDNLGDGTARLVHPHRTDVIEVLVCKESPNRIRAVWVNGERKLISRAIEFITEES